LRHGRFWGCDYYLRENNPLDRALITVGTIHGGVKNSIIHDEVKLQLTVRTYKPEVRTGLHFSGYRTNQPY
jgi:metal-dependent amidase/aminoacylase/carboxypeptidase family protein